MSKKNKDEPPKKLAVAILDANRVFQGIEEIDESSVTEDHVLLPDGCDLPANKYFWTGETFLPLLGTQMKRGQA